jgi:D-amino peptidase
VVKQSLGRFAADSMHPSQARVLIQEAAMEAVRDIGSAAPPSIKLPATLSVRMRNPDLAETATWIEGVAADAADPALVHLTDDDPIRLYRRFVTVVQLTRGIAE